MSVLDRLTQIQNGWTTALCMGIGFLLLVLIVGVLIVNLIKNNHILDKVFTVISVIAVICAVEIFGSLAGLFISNGQVSRTNYYADKYDIEQMTDDYDARVIEDDRNHKPYLVHYEGYGAEEWVYYVGKPDPQAQYLIQED